MDTLRSVAHLQREIGDEAFQELISSDHTEEVRQFAQGLVKKLLPTEMTVGGRTYDLLGFLREGDGDSVVGHTMVERAKDMGANLGQDDGEHILKHQDEIPASLLGKVAFVSSGWRHPDNPEYAYYVYWSGGGWAQGWCWLGGDGWNGHDRLLRRK